MSDYLSVLPTELVEKIFDHISIVDILSSVCLVNKRLYSISHACSRIPLDFNSIAQKKKQFDLLCKDLPNLTSRIVSLTFDNSNNRITFAKNIRFLCSITKNDTFPNLHSITLNKINLNVWNVFRIRLSSFMALRSMSIADVNDSEPTLISLILHDLLFTVRSLKRLFLHTSLCRYETITISSTSILMQTSAIECLTLTGIQINLRQLLVVASMLRQLDVKLFVRQSIYNDMIFESSVDLQQLSITTDHITILEIQCILSLMTRLIHLTLHIDKANSDLINGHTWIPLLTKIIVFQFMFGISKKDNVDLDSFRKSGNEFIGILHSLPHLRSLCLSISTLILLLDRHWPQIIDINMKNDFPRPYQCLSSTEIDAFCHSFTHLKQFAFDRQSVRQLSRFFNNITMTLSNISIRHHGKLSSYNPRVITREWLEQHTKQNDFDYFNDSEWDV